MASEGTKRSREAGEGEVRLREAWLGCGALYARRTLGNAEAWTPQQNLEYEAAFEAQRRDIEAALARESVPTRKRRESPWAGERRPDAADVVFDSFWPIKELEGGIQFKKGLIDRKSVV